MNDTPIKKAGQVLQFGKPPLDYVTLNKVYTN